MRSVDALIILVLGACAIAADAGPRMAVENPSWEFGCVTNTTYLMHDFVVSNSGDARLEIKRVVTSCDSCMNVALDEAVVAPGGWMTVHCRLDARQLRGDVYRVITLESKDPGAPAGILELSATVVPAYAVFPEELILGGAGEQRKNSVEVVPLLKLSEPFSRVECEASNVVADVFENPPGRYHVLAQVMEPVPRGRSVFGIIVRTANTNDLPCRIVGRIEFPADYEVMPSQLTFEAKDEPQTRILWLRQHEGGGVALRDAVPEGKEFRCEIEPDPTSGDYRIFVEARQLAALKGQSRVITLKGMTAENAEVVLPVRVTIH